MRIRRAVTAAVLAGGAGVGTLALTPAASATEPPRHDNHRVVVDHNRDNRDNRDHRDHVDRDRHRHRDLLAICRREHGHDHRAILVRVHDRHQLRYLERRFDLDCRILRVV